MRDRDTLTKMAVIQNNDVLHSLEGRSLELRRLARGSAVEGGAGWLGAQRRTLAPIRARII